MFFKQLLIKLISQSQEEQHNNLFPFRYIISNNFINFIYRPQKTMKFRRSFPILPQFVGKDNDSFYNLRNGQCSQRTKKKSPRCNYTVQAHVRQIRVSSDKNYVESRNLEPQILLPKVNKATIGQSPNKKTSYPQGKYSQGKYSQGKYSLSITLKPVPLPKQKTKTNFGWTPSHRGSFHNQSIKINRQNKSYTLVSEKYKNQWIQTLKQLKRQLCNINQKMTIPNPQFWNFLVSKFQKYHLNIDQKVEFLELVSKFFESDFGLSNIKDEFGFCEQMGKKFHQLQNRIHFKHKYCLQNLKFLADRNIHKQKFYSIHFPELKFNLQEKQVTEVCRIVKGFCQNNMDAFCFLTLYLKTSLKNRLKRQSFKNIEEEYIKRLDKLQQLNPASQQLTEGIQTIYGLENILMTEEMQTLVFKQSEESHLQQLKQVILGRAESAKEESCLFRQLVQDVCYKYGYSFKSGVKIKTSTNSSSIFRTIQKILGKKKFEKDLQLIKKHLLQGHLFSEKFSEQSITSEIQSVQRSIQLILHRETSMKIAIKDLLRAKCTFSKVQEIVQTAINLKGHIESQGFKIIELKNRLSKNTKDVTLIIKLPKSIAQLQLALKLDSVSNQFNHKIYELKRSKMHTPITNLFIHNERWCEVFFTEQFQLFEEVVNMQRQPDLKDQITFKRLKKDVGNFKNNYLNPDQVKYEKSLQTRREQKAKVADKINQIKKHKSKLVPRRGDQSKNKEAQKLNQISFLKSFDYEKSLELIQTIDHGQFEGSLVLLKLKGDILREHGSQKNSYQQSLRCYQTYVKVHRLSLGQDIDLADTYHSIGCIYDITQDYFNAVVYLQKSLEIKERVRGRESIDVAASLNGIGQVYSNKKNKSDYVMALDYYENSLKIREKLIGKQSIDVAASLSNIGVVYRRQGDHEKALQYHKQSLSIRQKILGKQSLDSAQSLYNIGLTYHRKQEYSKAFQFLQRSSQIRQKILGKDSVEVARTYLYISFVYQALDLLEKASHTINDAYSIFRKILGQEHDRTKFSYEQYIDIRDKIAKKDKFQATPPAFLPTLIQMSKRGFNH